MVKVNLGGCSSFVNDADYKEYLAKALDAFDVLDSETAGVNFTDAYMSAIRNPKNIEFISLTLLV